MPCVNEAFSREVRARRKTLGLTQMQLARNVGCSISLTRKIESGERRPTRQIAELMSAALCSTRAEREAFVALALAAALPNLSPALAPSPLTSLLGREKDLAALRQIIGQNTTRLITLAGAGGVGKTRLALALAADGALGGQDSVVFVNLAPVQNTALLMPAIARALGLRESDKHTAQDILRDRLSQNEVWLILDNVEQLLPEAAAGISLLLTECPKAKALVTSRESLNVRGERVYAVRPLAAEPSITLFEQRAQAAVPGFLVNDANQHIIGDICARLDGLPLAIELAAARMKAFSAQNIQTELSAGRAMSLLKTQMRDLPERHHALRDTIEWSSRQLSESQRQLFSLVCVFSGGWTLDSAQAVRAACCESNADIADDMTSLLDKNLIMRASAPNADPPRFDMLATIREFGRELLVSLSAAQAAHAQWFLGLARQAQAHLRGPDQHTWVENLEADHDNLRAALGWLIQNNDTRPALEFVQAMWIFWYIRGYYTEGRKWLDAALHLPKANGDDEIRGHALYGAGALSQLQGDMNVAAQYAMQSIPIWQKLGDARGLGQANIVLGNVAYSQGRMDDALAHHTSALNAFEQADDIRNSAIALNNLGQIHESASRLTHAHDCFDKSLSLARKLGDTRIIATLLSNLGVVLRRMSNKTLAVRKHEEALALRRGLGDPRGIANTLGNLGDSRLEAGQDAHAEYFESLRLFQTLGDKVGLIRGVERTAHFIAQKGNLGIAASLHRAAESAIQEYGLKRVPEDEDRVQSILALTDKRPAGKTLSLDQAIGLALETLSH